MESAGEHVTALEALESRETSEDPAALAAESSSQTKSPCISKTESDGKPALQSFREVEIASTKDSLEPIQTQAPDQVASTETTEEGEGHTLGAQTLDNSADSEDLNFFDDNSSEDEKQHECDGNAMDFAEDSSDETDDLYDKSSGGNVQTSQQYVCIDLSCGKGTILTHYLHQTSGPKLINSRLRLPKTSDIELFHCVLVRDADRLEEMLQDRSPSQVLDIRDSRQRTLYHYGTLCADDAIKGAVFGHVNNYNESRLTNQIGKIMQEKGVVERLLSQKRSEWVPPSVKELAHKSVTAKQRDWELICRCVDFDKRSILHYAAASPGCSVFENDPNFTETVQAKRDIAGARDADNKTPLHVAVEVGNIRYIKWCFKLGFQIQQEDVRSLLHLNRTKVVQEILLHQLERRDALEYRARQLGGSNCDSDGRSKREWDLGVGVLARAELQRTQTHQRGEYAASLLLDAAKYAHLESVKVLLRQGANPNVCDSNGWTTLHVCANEGTNDHIKIVRMLLDHERSINVDHKSLKGRTPLHIAAQSWLFGDQDDEGTACREMISTLCEYGASTEARDRSGNTPLHLACRSNNTTALEALMKAGCSMTAVDNSGRNSLHLAALRGNIQVIRRLISWEEGAACLSNVGDNRGRTPVEVARNEEARQQLANKWSLCYRGNVIGIKRQLSRLESLVTTSRASFDNSFVSDRTMRSMRTPLHLTVQGYFDLLQISDSSKRRQTRSQSTRQEESPRLRYLQLVTLLLHAGADPDAVDKWGVTPIMIAAAINDERFLEVLLESQTSASRLQITDEDGNSALHYSYAFCNASNSSILEDEMDEEEATNNVGKTPLEMTGFRDRIFPAGCRVHLRALQDKQSSKLHRPR